MPIGDPPRHIGRVRRQRISKSVQVDVVVADAVHLGKTHRKTAGETDEKGILCRLGGREKAE
jgi:hypothetical protein